MAGYSIWFRKSAYKELGKIPKNDLRRILKRIEALSDNPRPIGCEKLSAQEYYRIRQGDHRIIYSVQDGEKSIWIVKIGHRREVYRH